MVPGCAQGRERSGPAGLDPGWLEWSQGYGRGGTAAPFGALVDRPEGDLPTRKVVEPDAQESSEYGRVTAPGEVTVCGARIVCCVGRFGSLALANADNPGPMRTRPRRTGRCGPCRR